MIKIIYITQTETLDILNGNFDSYKINPLGFIVNSKEKILKTRQNNRGYYVVDLYDNSHIKHTFLLHRLVALTFIPNPLNLPTVNHKNGNKNDNSVFNLEWVSYSDNNKHAYNNGLHESLKGVDSPFCKHEEKIIRKVCEMLEKEKSPKKISEKLNLPLHLVRSIKNKESWTHISSQYNMIPVKKHKK